MGELSPERRRRLAELRAKYPKPEPEMPTARHEVTQRAYVKIGLTFEFYNVTRAEARYKAYQWIWKHGYTVTDELYKRYAIDGVRAVWLET